jgi:hypothetical protein
VHRARRPFSWKGQIYLSHWLALPPGQERAALARLDLEHGSLEHVYRFEVLQEELAKYHGRRTRTHDRSTSGLEQARAPQSSIIRILAFAAGKTDFARQKFGLMAEGLKHVRQPGQWLLGSCSSFGAYTLTSFGVQTRTWCQARWHISSAQPALEVQGGGSRTELSGKVDVGGRG